MTEKTDINLSVRIPNFYGDRQKLEDHMSRILKVAGHRSDSHMSEIGLVIDRQPFKIFIL